MSVLADLLLSIMQLSVEGTGETGYRIRTQSPGAASQVFYVVREDNQYRILGAAGENAGVGELVLEAIAKGNLPLARQWLDRLRQDQPLEGGEDPLAGPLLPRFWESGRTEEAAAMQSAAAALMAGSELSLKAVPLLEQGRARPLSDTEKSAFDLALVRSYSKLEKLDELLTVAQRLVKVAPKSATAFRALQEALTGLQRWNDAEREARVRLQALPDDVDALRALAQLGLLRGQPAQVEEQHARLVALGKAEAQDYNTVAWAALMSAAVDPKAIEAAERGTALSRNQEGPVIHTLACLYAEVGRTSEARERLLHLMEVWGLEEPESETWFGFGRIAEQFGMRDAAIAAFRRVEPPKKKFQASSSTWALAQRRLQGLGAAAEKPLAPK